jgi:hypothetical protein
LQTASGIKAGFYPLFQRGRQCWLLRKSNLNPFKNSNLALLVDVSQKLLEKLINTI